MNKKSNRKIKIGYFFELNEKFAEKTNVYVFFLYAKIIFVKTYIS